MVREDGLNDIYAKRKLALFHSLMEELPYMGAQEWEKVDSNGSIQDHYGHASRISVQYRTQIHSQPLFVEKVTKFGRGQKVEYRLVVGEGDSAIEYSGRPYEQEDDTPEHCESIVSLFARLERRFPNGEQSKTQKKKRNQLVTIVQLLKKIEKENEDATETIDYDGLALQQYTLANEYHPNEYVILSGLEIMGHHVEREKALEMHSGIVEICSENNFPQPVFVDPRFSPLRTPEEPIFRGRSLAGTFDE